MNEKMYPHQPITSSACSLLLQLLCNAFRLMPPSAFLKNLMPLPTPSYLLPCSYYLLQIIFHICPQPFTIAFSILKQDVSPTPQSLMLYFLFLFLFLSSLHYSIKSFLSFSFLFVISLFNFAIPNTCCTGAFQLKK